MTAMGHSVWATRLNPCCPETVREALKEKHPPKQTGKESAITTSDTLTAQPPPNTLQQRRWRPYPKHRLENRQSCLVLPVLQGLMQQPGNACATPSKSTSAKLCDKVHICKTVRRCGCNGQMIIQLLHRPGWDLNPVWMSSHSLG